MNKQTEHEPEPDAEPIHPYILEALQAARAGDLDAIPWLELDCIGWTLIEPNAAILATREVYAPARKPRRKKTAQEAPGRTQRTATGRSIARTQQAAAHASA